MAFIKVLSVIFEETKQQKCYSMNVRLRNTTLNSFFPPKVEITCHDESEEKRCF